MAGRVSMMLLDTCVLYWLEQSPDRISTRVGAALADSTKACFASGISALEIGLKVAQGAIKLPLPSGEWMHQVCQRRGIVEIPVTFAIAGNSAALPPIHRDPFDRILVATALEHGLTLLTPDRLIAQYPNLKTLW
ncbi:MAG: type II toxin-antitoxin system VapC family toxin [Verrucomicrobia bacterium]|nr:type II toxin-antitoxin system VapC family toxin [Verrucomicrobiota bacterium]